ncbi:MAG: hypothetical protein QY327_12495 [Fimbriimonadaceae bacterium]|nr:MAG: hypothetical protein UZ18_ATM001002160 [Armatimonadetes bacterium OLB18]WKZ80146.1 MAG: hypothetical protein QY327_12495 [Fimbriimonadaceae bacterium]
MARKRIAILYNEFEARELELRLKDIGLPVWIQVGHTGIPLFQPSGPFEIWINDESLLRDPAIRERVDSALGTVKFSPEDEERIASMKFVDYPIERGLWFALAGFVLFIALIVWLVPKLATLFSGY